MSWKVRGRRKGGFSLLEIMVVIVILILLLGIGLVNYRGGARKAAPQALATALVAELQAARVRALQSHTYVLLEFPSNGQGSCQSFSRYEGLSRARYVKGRNFSQEFSNSSIFIGQWPVASGSFTTVRPPNGLEIPGFQLNTLLNPLPSSYLLAFTPSGGAVSNDWPMLDGRYQIVVGADINAVPTAAPAGAPSVTPRPPYFSLQAVSQPQRIEIDTTGGVSLKSDLKDANGVNLNPVGGGSQAAPVAAVPTNPGNHAPVVEKVELSPGAPNLPSGVQGTVSKEDYLRLRVEATDADGDALTCQWSSRNGGAFTAEGPSEMRWDANLNRWVSSWTFRANPADPPLTHYDIECKVTDPSNTPATCAAGVTLTQTIELRTKPFFAFCEWPPHGLYTCNVDGSNFNQIPTPGLQPSFVSVHPDGNTIAFTDADYVNNQFHIWAMNKDGSNLHRLTAPAFGATTGSFSPDGTMYAFAHGASYYVMPACGEVTPTPAAVSKLPPVPIPMPAGVGPSWYRPSWDCTSKKLLYTGRIAVTNEEALFVCDMSGGIASAVTTKLTPDIPRALVPNAVMWQGCYSRDPANPNLIVGVRYVGPGWGLFKMRDDASGFTDVNEPLGSGFVQYPSLTRDNTGLIYRSGNSIYCCDFNFLTGATSNPQVLYSNIQSEGPCPW